jgi:hypothetical protein
MRVFWFVLMASRGFGFQKFSANQNNFEYFAGISLTSEKNKGRMGGAVLGHDDLNLSTHSAHEAAAMASPGSLKKHTELVSSFVPADIDPDAN